MLQFGRKWAGGYYSMCAGHTHFQSEKDMETACYCQLKTHYQRVCRGSTDIPYVAIQTEEYM